MDYCTIEWFALEANRDHFVHVESASKYCISDSSLDYDGYSISSKAFLPTLVDIICRVHHAKYGLYESQDRIKITGRNINNLRYADDTTLMAKSEEELERLLMRVRE